MGRTLALGRCVRVALVGCALAACGGTSSESADPCRPGEHRDCSCPNGELSSQACMQDGSDWDACACDGSVAAGGGVGIGGNQSAGIGGSDAVGIGGIETGGGSSDPSATGGNEPGSGGGSVGDGGAQSTGAAGTSTTAAGGVVTGAGGGGGAQSAGAAGTTTAAGGVATGAGGLVSGGGAAGGAGMPGGSSAGGSAGTVEAAGAAAGRGGTTSNAGGASGAGGGYPPDRCPYTLPDNSVRCRPYQSDNCVYPADDDPQECWCRVIAVGPGDVLENFRWTCHSIGPVCPTTQPEDGASCAGVSTTITCVYGVPVCDCVENTEGDSYWECTGGTAGGGGA